jgi:hypothetical protein
MFAAILPHEVGVALVPLVWMGPENIAFTGVRTLDSQPVVSRYLYTRHANFPSSWQIYLAASVDMHQHLVCNNNPSQKSKIKYNF